MSICSFSDSSNGEWEFSNDENWTQPQLDEDIQDAFPIFQKIKSKTRRNRRRSSIFNNDNFDPILKIRNKTNWFDLSVDYFEQISTILVVFPHLNQLPKANSSYEESLPCIVGLINTRKMIGSEYPNMIQSYFKNGMKMVNNNLKYFFAVSPSQERFDKLTVIRYDVPYGRILFHYLGYGFPDINENGIWSFERKTGGFKNYKFFDQYQLCIYLIAIMLLLQ